MKITEWKFVDITSKDNVCTIRGVLGRLLKVK